MKLARTLLREPINPDTNLFYVFWEIRCLWGAQTRMLWENSRSIWLLKHCPLLLSHDVHQLHCQGRDKAYQEWFHGFWTEEWQLWWYMSIVLWQGKGGTNVSGRLIHSAQVLFQTGLWLLWIWDSESDKDCWARTNASDKVGHEYI